MTSWWYEHRVRERAYEIWEREGRPEGKADEHWQRAAAEIAAEQKEAAAEAQLESEGTL